MAQEDSPIFITEDAVDPSTSDDSRIIYDREVPIEIRNNISGDSEIRAGTLEAIKIKILIQGSDDSPSLLRLELTSETDLFFHYMHIIDRNSFRLVQEQQKFMIDFSEYANVLIRMLNSCIREPHAHLAVFLMQGENDARLDFIQNLEYKFVELMSCTCERSPEEMVQRSITYRYNSIKHRMGVLQSRLYEIQNLVKVKNPSLLLQLQRSVNNATGSTVTVRK